MRYFRFTEEGISQKFWSNVDQSSDGCWEWLGKLTDTGRGRFSIGRRYGLSTNASRTAYILTYGKIPSLSQVLHKCDNPKCCNPIHLFLGDPQKNMRDKVLRGRIPTFSSYKLNFELAEQIRKDPRHRVKIAQEYGISLAMVSRIRRSKSWSRRKSI